MINNLNFSLLHTEIFEIKISKHMSLVDKDVQIQKLYNTIQFSFMKLKYVRVKKKEIL